MTKYNYSVKEINKQSPLYHKTLFIIVLIAGITIVTYFPILNNLLIDLWDDQWQVINTATESGFTIKNIISILTSFQGGQYSPLNQLCYTVIYFLCGYTPLGYHLFSLLLHIGSTLLVYFIALKLLKQLLSLSEKDIKNISLLACILFSIHPLQVESVAWVSASKVVLFAFFYLLSTYMYTFFIERKKYQFYFLAIFFFILSFGGKEQAVIFPVWLLILYWVYGYNLKSKDLWLHSFPFFVLSVFFGVITILSQDSNRGGLFSYSETYSFFQRIILASYSLTEYLTKWLFPVKLQYIYPFPFSVNEKAPFWLVMYPVILVAAIYLFKAFFSKKIVLFSILFFLIHIIFVLHIVSISRFVVTADRYIYISAIGLSIIVSYYIVLLLNKLKNRIKRNLLVLLLMVYVMTLSIYSNYRCRVWYSTDTLKKEIREQLNKRNEFQIDLFQ